MQAAGFAVVADRLNQWRYISHFRAVHRGQFFTTMKTTSVRKLLGDSWGFLCPVHTPDGEPCGLLNHLAAAANVIATPVRGEGEAEREALARRLVRSSCRGLRNDKHVPHVTTPSTSASRNRITTLVPPRFSPAPPPSHNDRSASEFCPLAWAQLMAPLCQRARTCQC